MPPSFNSEVLYGRLLKFANSCGNLVSRLPKQITNLEYGRQLVRSSASIGANYIEAIEGFSRKEFILRLKICRKETKESNHWLTLISSANNVAEVSRNCEVLISEGRELIRIFASSINTSERNLEIQKISK